jgi:hypothetical protein
MINLIAVILIFLGSLVGGYFWVKEFDKLDNSYGYLWSCY